MGKAFFEVSESFLRDILKLPSGTKIVGARYDAFVDAFNFAIEHDDLKAVIQGASIPRVEIQYTQVHSRFKQQGEAT